MLCFTRRVRLNREAPPQIRRFVAEREVELNLFRHSNFEVMSLGMI